MPIPTPKKGQSKSEFISQCMGNPTMINEFPDQKQRAAVCYSKYEDKKSKASYVIKANQEEYIYETEPESDKTV